MDYPLPIRTHTSTKDLSTPLFVDTNIVYQIDEMKFPGLQESSHSSEPALICESDFSYDSNTTCAELPDTPTTTWDAENQDLYNLIDSLDTEDTMFFPVDTVDIWDLPAIQIELRKDELSVCEINTVMCRPTSVFELSSVHNVPGQLDGVTAEYPYAFALHNDNVFEEVKSCEVLKQSTSKIDYKTQNCRFPNSRKHPSQKKRLSSAQHEDVLESIQIDPCLCTKRRKLDVHELCLNTHSKENYFESVIDDNSSQSSFYSDYEQTFVFNICESYSRSSCD